MVPTMQQIDLAPFAALCTGSETPVLPAASFRVRERGVAFPVSTPTLTPLAPHPMTLHMPRVSLFHFEQARLHGFRLMEAVGQHFHDLSLVSPATVKFPARPDLNMVEEVTGLPDAQSSSGRTHPEVVRDVVFCGIHELSNFGSWLFRALPKLLLAQEYLPGLPVMMNTSAGWMRQLIDLAYPDATLVEHRPALSYRLENVVVPSLPTPEAYLRPELQQRYSALLDGLPLRQGTPERIYLSRRAQAAKLPEMRVLTNEAELIGRLEERGFVEFIPEQHPIAEQLAVISQARVIVCPGGSGLFGCLFARQAEMIVDLEANGEWLHAHRNVLDASGRPFALAQGVQPADQPAPHGPMHRNWHVDAEGVVLGLKHLGG
jgi:capsular polysaccharide biosynthesis protein